jgi:SWI/SNF-related matrix-associated actin-dependent regulator 1 of chromatin subfamily A
MTVRRKLAIAKAPLILEHIKDTLQEVAQVVVFVHHRELYTYLLGNLSKVVGINGLTSTKDRQYHVDTFQSGEAEVLVCSLRAANTGLTLTAAYTMIMGEYDWVPSTNEQAEGRIYRVTQKEICRVKYIVAAETIDERVLNVVQRKQKEISRLVD